MHIFHIAKTFKFFYKLIKIFLFSMLQTKIDANSTGYNRIFHNYLYNNSNYIHPIETKAARISRTDRCRSATRINNCQAFIPLKIIMNHLDLPDLTISKRTRRSHKRVANYKRYMRIMIRTMRNDAEGAFDSHETHSLHVQLSRTGVRVCQG